MEEKYIIENPVSIYPADKVSITSTINMSDTNNANEI
jgi:hypothetical protein